MFYICCPNIRNVRHWFAALLLLAAIWGATAMASRHASPVPAVSMPTDYAIELRQIDQDIAALRPAAFTSPVDVEKTTRFVYRVYHRASLTFLPGDFEEAAEQINHAISLLGPMADLCALRADLDMKFHRVAEARQHVEQCSELANSPAGQATLGDLAFQAGRIDEARARYEGAIARDPAWHLFARLA